MPGARCARSRVCNVERNSTRVVTVTPESPGIPRAMVYGLFRALPGDRALLPPSPAEKLARRDLTPASRRQDHTTSPSASGALVRSTSASIASRPAFVTIANRPSDGKAGRAEYKLNDLRFRKIRIFFTGGGQPTKSMTTAEVRALSQLFGAAQAADHRDFYQILAGQSWIGGGLPEHIPEFIVVGFEIVLVLDRLALDISFVTSRRCRSKRSSSASGLRRARPRQAFGQIDRVVNAAIHAHAAERIVDMRGIADQEGAADAGTLWRRADARGRAWCGRSRSASMPGTTVAISVCANVRRSARVRRFLPPRSGTSRATGRGSAAGNASARDRRDSSPDEARRSRCGNQTAC